MKKVIGIIIALVIVIAAICVIVYMVSNDSLSGNSQEGQVSKEIDENLNTTDKIDPVKPYPADYKECTEVATEEKNSNARPEFKLVI